MRILVCTLMMLLFLGSTTAGAGYYGFDPFEDLSSPLYGMDRKEFEAKWAKKCEQAGHKPGSEAFGTCMARQYERLQILFRPRGKGR